MHLFNDDIRNSLSSEFPDESQSFDLLMDAVTSNSAIKATSKYSTAPAGNGRTNQQMNSAMPTGNAKGDKLDLTEAKSGTTSKPKRRRECLNHLTFEEKMMRRKLKNRLSAQSARDRKKDKMVNLQDHLETLDKEKMEALRQNEILRLQNEYLEKENVKLRRQLESYQTTTTDNSKSFPTEAKESEKADNSKAGEPIPNFFQSPVSSFVNNNSSSSFRCSTLVPSTCLAENANTSSILPSVSNKGTSPLQRNSTHNQVNGGREQDAPNNHFDFISYMESNRLNQASIVSMPSNPVRVHADGNGSLLPYCLDTFGLERNGGCNEMYTKFNPCTKSNAETSTVNDANQLLQAWLDQADAVARNQQQQFYQQQQHQMMQKMHQQQSSNAAFRKASEPFIAWTGSYVGSVARDTFTQVENSADKSHVVPLDAAANNHFRSIDDHLYSRKNTSSLFEPQSIGGSLNQLEPPNTVNEPLVVQSSLCSANNDLLDSPVAFEFDCLNNSL